MHDRGSEDGFPVLPSHELPLDGFSEALDLPRVTLSPLPPSPLFGGAMPRSRAGSGSVIGGGPPAAEVLLPTIEHAESPLGPALSLPAVPGPTQPSVVHVVDHDVSADDLQAAADNRLVIAVLVVAVVGMVVLALTGSAG